MNEHPAWNGSQAFVDLLLPGGLLCVGLLVFWIWMATIGEASQIKSDEQVVLFPVAAHLRRWSRLGRAAPRLGL